LIFEKRYDNGVLGMVGHHLAKSHFELVKQNDPYFYAWDRAVGDFVIEIHNTRLYSAIIKNSNIPVSSITHPNTFVVRY
jgi:hypothetical protein